MKAILKFIVISACFLMLLGCSEENVKSIPIYKKAEEIKDSVHHAKWEKAEEEAKAINEIYKKNKWKYQLLGNEGEYTDLAQEISRLHVAVEEKDKLEAKTNALLIQDYIRAIYFR